MSMRVLFRTALVVAVLWIQAGPVLGGGNSGLDRFIRDLNVQAQADMGRFKTRLSVQFNVAMPEVEALIKAVDTAADAYLCFRVAQIARRPMEVVLGEYQAHRGKGWGVIAKNLGIKPGSKEFHDLKKGYITSQPEAGHGKGRGKGPNK